MSPELTSIVAYMKFINRFMLVKRTLFVPNETTRFENDAEHSYQLTMTAWYIIQSKQLPLDIDKVLKYALVHDLVETYAGDLDPFMYANDPNYQQRKSENEAQALQKIKNNFPDFPDMIDWIEKYEQRQDEESKFVYALDKFIAKVNGAILLNKKWSDHGITRESILKEFGQKVSQSEYVQLYYQELIQLWDKDPEFYASQSFIPDYKKEFLKTN